MTPDTSGPDLDPLIAFVRVHGDVAGIPCETCAGPVPALPVRKDRRYCKPACRAAGYHARKGLPVDEPCPKLSRDSEVRTMILALLADGREYEPGDFTRATGLTWARINPRLRDLRKAAYGSFDIACRLRERRADGVKIYVYRHVGKEREDEA